MESEIFSIKVLRPAAYLNCTMNGYKNGIEEVHS
jgi:hypothetical protein